MVLKLFGFVRIQEGVRRNLVFASESRSMKDKHESQVNLKNKSEFQFFKNKRAC